MRLHDVLAGHSPAKTGVNAIMSRPCTSFYAASQNVDARHKAGHDDGETIGPLVSAYAALACGLDAGRLRSAPQAS